MLPVLELPIGSKKAYHGGANGPYSIIAMVDLSTDSRPRKFAFAPFAMLQRLFYRSDQNAAKMPLVPTTSDDIACCLETNASYTYRELDITAHICTQTVESAWHWLVYIALPHWRLWRNPSIHDSSLEFFPSTEARVLMEKSFEACMKLISYNAS